MAVNLVLGQWVTVATDSVRISINTTTTMSLSIQAMLVSQDASTNKSNIKIKLDYSWDDWTACYRTDFYLNGDWIGYGNRSFGTSYQNFEQWPLSGTLKSADLTIEHNSDGTKSFNISGGYEFANNGVSPTYFSGDVVVPTINRGASITCSPSILTITGESSITFTINDTESREHILDIRVGDYTQRELIPAGTTTFTWTPTKDIIKQIGTGNLVAKATVTTVLRKGSTPADQVIVTKEVNFGVVISDMATAKITMENGKVTFNLNGIFASFDGLFGTRTPLATKVVVMMNQNGTTPLLPYMEVDKVVLSKDTWNQLVNGDVIRIDTAEATIYKNNSVEHRLGALGNDYETFVLVPGQNQIQCLASDWLETEPEFKLKYREVFL